MLESAALLRERIPQLRIIHQTGERDYNDAQAAYAASDEHADGEVEVYRFIDDMPAFFARADLVAMPLRSQHGGGNSRCR